MKNLIILLFVLSFLTASASYQYHGFDGAYFIHDEFLEDFKLDGIQAASFFLHGDAAEKLYKSMRVKAHENRCTQAGDVTKDMKGFECTKRIRGDYICTFSLDLELGIIEEVNTC